MTVAQIKPTAFEAAIGRALRHKRIVYGQSQTEFAKCTGFSKAQISLVETGQRAASIRALKTFCDHLEISVSSLIASAESEFDG